MARVDHAEPERPDKNVHTAHAVFGRVERRTGNRTIHVHQDPTPFPAHVLLNVGPVFHSHAGQIAELFRVERGDTEAVMFSIGGNE